MIVLVVGIAACGDNTPGATNCDVPGYACRWLGLPGALQAQDPTDGGSAYVTTFAGQTGYNGDGHDRLDTEVYWPMDIRFTADGTVWFIDWNNHLIRKVIANGTIVTVVGSLFPGDGDLGDPGAEESAQGAPGADVQLNHPTQLAQLADGTFMMAAWHNHKLRRFDPATGNTWIVAGNLPGFKGDGGAVDLALFNRPDALVLDDQQNVYVLDQANQRIRRIDAATQIITTIVGTAMPGFSGDGGPATAAQLSFQIGDNPEPNGGLAYANGTLYIGDTMNHRIRAVDLTSGIITTIAGTGVAGYGGDFGPATLAQLDQPHGLMIGPDGDLYIADTNNMRIRAMNLSTGSIRTVAGNGSQGLDVDDGLLATDMQLNRPFGMNFDPDGNLFVLDTMNSRIVRVAQ